MKDADLYRILGVGHSASADEIRTAFRDLVKRFHPDLFATSADKERATEKLTEINEAYAVLGNPERRRNYDESLVQERKEKRSKPRPTRVRVVRRRAKAPRPRKQRKKRFSWNFLSRRRLGYAAGAAIIVILAFYAAREQPRVSTGWRLLEKIEITSAGASLPRPENTWDSLGDFESAAECTRVLKEKVREEEEQGGKAVFDERNALAIIVRVKSEAARASPPEPSRQGLAPGEPQASNFSDATGASGSSNPIVRQVRNLECRGVRRVDNESWAQRMLRRLNLSS